MDIDSLVHNKEATWIDVRSPLEYEKGHFPTACNVSLFSNESRALVGTVYKQKGKNDAIELGLSLVDFSGIAKKLRQFSIEKPLIIYCARGGMRSQGVGFLAQLLGFKVFLVKGGYKTIRKWVLDQFSKKYILQILGGRTGVGKTHYLSLLQEKKEQVIDLEDRAAHKGSAFGGIEKIQPSQEHFENRVAYDLFFLDKTKKIWVEDESRFIGKLRIPDNFFEQMRDSPIVVLENSIQERIVRTCEDYASCEREQLEKSIERIQKKLGGVKTEQALGYLELGCYEKCCEILFSYYDKSYDFDLSKRESFCIKRVSMEGKTEGAVLRELLTT